MGLVFLDIS